MPTKGTLGDRRARGSGRTHGSRVARLLDEADVPVPRGEPRRRLAEVANALAERATVEQLQAKLAAAAETLWDDDARSRVARAVSAHDNNLLAPAELNLPAGRAEWRLHSHTGRRCRCSSGTTGCGHR